MLLLHFFDHGFTLTGAPSSGGSGNSILKVQNVVEDVVEDVVENTN